MMPLDICLFKLLKDRLYDNPANPLRSRAKFRNAMLRIIKSADFRKTSAKIVTGYARRLKRIWKNKGRLDTQHEKYRFKRHREPSRVNRKVLKRKSTKKLKRKYNKRA
jgi:hypothetical protein